MAGCYQVLLPVGGVGPDEEQALFAPLDQLLQHIARAETYVLRHCRGPNRFSEGQVRPATRRIPTRRASG
eukprot:16014004-Heterocapsa_arctica.AAC.1